MAHSVLFKLYMKKRFVPLTLNGQGVAFFRAEAEKILLEKRIKAIEVGGNRFLTLDAAIEFALTLKAKAQPKKRRRRV